MRQTPALFFALFFFSSAMAQVQHSSWLATFHTYKLNDRLSLHFDAQVRSSDDLAAVQTILLRPGLNVHLDKWVLSAGYAYIPNRRAVEDISGYLAEHRTWQQAVFTHKSRHVSIAHRFRFEQRFLPKSKVVNNDLETGGHDAAFRLRYFVRSIIPATQQPSFTKGLFFALQNELFLNTGNTIPVKGKTFDQNRLYAAVGYRLPRKIDLEAGYMNQYTTTRLSFVNNHILQIALYKRL